MKIILLESASLIVHTGVIAYAYVDIDGRKERYYNLELFGYDPHFFRSEEDLMDEIKGYGLFDPLKEKPHYVEEILGVDVSSYRGIADSYSKGVDSVVRQFIDLLLALTRCDDYALKGIVEEGKGKDIMDLEIPNFRIRL